MNRFRERFSAGGTLIVGHRGDSLHAPENTLPAARLAHAAGADAWELDVRLSRDGVPVVLHDASLARTTDVAHRHAGDARVGRGALAAEFDWPEIATLDAGRHRVGAGGDPVGVPSLRQALELTRDLDWLVNVELKWSPGRLDVLLAAVLAEIDRTATAARVLISSFNHEAVARVAAARPDLATGALVDAPVARPGRYVRDLVGADAYHVTAAALGVAPREGPTAVPALDDLRRAGVAVLVYTVNDPSPDGLAQHLRDAGVAAIITDDPGSLADAWRNRPARTS